MKIHRLDHIHVYCSDPDASMRFYTDVFEAQTLGTAHGSDGGLRYFLSLGGLTLVLAPYPQGTEPRIPLAYLDGIYPHGYGVGHIGLHVENVDESVECVRQRGAKILAELRSFPALVLHMSARPTGLSLSSLSITNSVGSMIKQRYRRQIIHKMRLDTFRAKL